MCKQLWSSQLKGGGHVKKMEGRGGGEAQGVADPHKIIKLSKAFQIKIAWQKAQFRRASFLHVCNIGPCGLSLDEEREEWWQEETPETEVARAQTVTLLCLQKGHKNNYTETEVKIPHPCGCVLHREAPGVIATRPRG
jgi:hypothetical protein